MRAKYDPRMLNLTTTNHVGATGDLIPLMEDIGADVIGMDHIQCNPGAALRDASSASFFTCTSNTSSWSTARVSASWLKTAAAT